MQTKTLSFLVSTSLVATSALAFAGSAEAAIIKGGSILGFNGSVQFTPTSISFLDAAQTVQPPGSSGTTFTSFSTKSFSGITAGTSSPILSFSNTVPPNPPASLDLTSIGGFTFSLDRSTIATSTSTIGATTFVFFKAKGSVTDGADTAKATYSFTATSVAGGPVSTYGGQVEVVPEPFTGLGAGLAIGLGTWFKSKKKKQ